MTASTRTLPSRLIVRATAALFAGALTFVLTPVARADTVTDVPKIEVKYTDLDLATDQGARTLYRRIAAAARQVCPHGEGSIVPKMDELSRTCIRESIARAVREVNSQRLAEVEAAELARRTKTG
jgi:UrcA family protein